MILSVASQKGGTGKTTTSLSLAAGIARKGKRVLLIDVDSQANSSKVLIPEYLSIKEENSVCVTILKRKPLQIHHTSIQNLDIVPSHILLSNTDVQLTTALDHREARLKNQLEKVKEQYDHIIIDCPPALSWLTVNAFTASEKVLVVVSPGYFELDSVIQIYKTIHEVRKEFNSGLGLAGYLFTMSDPTINSQVSLDILRKNYPNKLLNTVIPRNTDIRDAHFNKQDIFTFSPSSKSAQAYKRLLEELSL